MSEAKLLAMAIFELRVILSGAVELDAPHDLRVAERLAYALHNDALAVMDGKPFDCEAALRRIANIDKIIGGNEGQRISEQMRSALSSAPTA